MFERDEKISLGTVDSIYNDNVDEFCSRQLFRRGSPDEEMIREIESEKIAIYTVVVGDAKLEEPQFIDENCDYICFTDNSSLKSDNWKIMQMDESFLDDYRKKNLYKIFPHKYLSQYEYSLYIDNDFQIKGSLREFISRCVNGPMICVVQPDGDCIFNKTYFSAHFKRFYRLEVNRQLRRYWDENMPKNYGMVSSDIIFRQHNNPEIIKLMEDWWEDIIDYSTPAQISFIYNCWKHDFHPAVAKIFLFGNEFWTINDEYLKDFKNPRYLTSEKLVKELRGNISDKNILTKEELSLLVHDIEILKHEATNLNIKKYKKQHEVDQLMDSLSWKTTESLRSFRNSLRQ